jgi:hypothetical protein
MSDHAPGYWMNETSGVLAPAVEASLLFGEEPTLFGDEKIVPRKEPEVR